MCNNVPKRKYEGNRKNRKEIEKGKYQMYPETRNKNKTLNNINNEMKKRKEGKPNSVQVHKGMQANNIANGSVSNIQMHLSTLPIIFAECLSN